MCVCIVSETWLIGKLTGKDIISIKINYYTFFNIIFYLLIQMKQRRETVERKTKSLNNMVWIEIGNPKVIRIFY